MFKRIPVVIILISMFAAAAMLAGCEKKRTASGKSCNENLAKIGGGKGQLALEKNLEKGSEVKWEDLVAAPDGTGGYLKKTPVCPKGGTYTLGKIGEDPTCTCGARLP